MSDRPWFYALEGQQRGPLPERQLQDLISRGIVRPDTLVWTEGMANWQNAADVPGLIGGNADSLSALPVDASTAVGHPNEALSIDLPIWSYLGRSLLYIIGIALVIPAPWTATGFYQWMVSRLHVPGRPGLAFTGKVGDIWYVFIGIGALSYVSTSHSFIIELISFVAQAILSWLVLRWLAANLRSNGQLLPIAFNGSVWTFIGWQFFIVLAIFTIVGWAWVTAAWVRWICRNIDGTRREILFLASGWDVLWRTILFAIGCALLIPIPWALRWYTVWYVSQFALAERRAAVVA